MADDGLVVGEEIVLTMTFRSAGVLASPTTVTMTTYRPDGTDVDAELASVSTGVFEHVQLLDQVGVWRFYCRGTGVVQAATRRLVVVGAERG